MSEPHTPSLPAHLTPATRAGDSLWRQGAGVGTAVGFALSVALAIGIGTNRFPSGGADMLLAQLAGIGIGTVIGAFAGLFVGAWITVDNSSNH